MAVNGIGGINTIIPSITVSEGTGKSDGTDSLIPFADYLKDAMNQTNDLLLQADQLSEDFAAGKTDNIHQVLIAAEKADVALQFTMQVRNKILDAYNEIMRMQI